ncbi:MAG: hypothetical protein ABIK76_01600 [candidate division WOR-3 bacterium]
MKKIGIISWQKDSQYAYSLASTLAGDLIKISTRNKFDYFLNFIKTLTIINKKKYNFFILEIPPIYLSYLIFFYKKNVMIISHSNVFLLNNWWHRLQRCLLKYFLKKTKGLIVHNEKILELLKNYSIRKLVIEPPPRKLKITQLFEKREGDSIKALIVLSFSPDEPIEELIAGCKELTNINFYLTGDYSKFPNYKRVKEIRNITFTGYLKKEDYEKLLSSVDFVIGLTTRDYTTLQSGYDALGGEKPFLTSDKEVLKEYFFKGAVFVKNEKEDIKRGIKKILEQYEVLESEVKELKKIKIKKWEENIKTLREIIDDC